MKETIEQLWYGNLTPADRCGVHMQEMERLTTLMNRYAAKLEETLNDAEKTVLHKYIDCADEYASLLMSQAFQEGFSLASHCPIKYLRRPGGAPCCFCAGFTRRSPLDSGRSRRWR